jgi:hypothetical protein
MPNNRVSLAFTRLPDAELGSFAENTVVKMSGNPSFPQPPVPTAGITIATDTFLADLAASQGGGKLATAKKNASRAALILLLRQQAAYVQGLAGTDLASLLSSGFESTSTNRTRIVLPQVNVKNILAPQSGSFRVVVEPVPTSRGYELRYKNGTGDYVPAGVFTSSRGIVLPNLAPGSTYTVQVRAIGGVTGYSDWSDPVSRMAT